ncbi:MAG: acetyl-CoA carboxylase biotin carboxyl carrier protein [Cytophagales bacterium]|nr:acetyl-CoA carboxylase biotin carboxyl carrier protein [Cytophagales bacterium]
MKTKDIIELIDFISKSELSEIKLETEDIKISVKRDSQVETRFVEAPVVATTPVAPVAPVTAPPAVTAPTTPAATETTAPAAETASANQITIKSEMIGTFYRKANPESPNFVEVGDEIKEGDTLCVIEAMKLFNEIESEVKGRIVKILVEDSTPVEFDQPLFIVEPI